LTATDVSSRWTELRYFLNNAHSWTFKALSNIRTTVLFPVLEFHRDNGSECINHATEIWRKQQRLPFARSYDHKKNDTCFVEQKNDAVVREYAGYDRLEGFEEQTFLAAVYKPLVPLLNFFVPSQKCSSKTRSGSKEIKVYDKPNSPFQRLAENVALRRSTRIRSMPWAHFTPRLNFSGMSTGLSRVCVGGLPSQTASRRGNRNSFREHFKMGHCGGRIVKDVKKEGQRVHVGRDRPLRWQQVLPSMVVLFDWE
jgi:hypothetical protein